MINVVVDFSGSMRPNGKFAIVRNTCVALNMTTKCRFLKWKNKVEDFKIDENFDWFSEFSVVGFVFTFPFFVKRLYKTKSRNIFLFHLTFDKIIQKPI